MARYHDATIPLFGEDSPKVRTIEIGFAVVTMIFVVATMAYTFVLNSRKTCLGTGSKTLPVYFGIVLFLSSLPQFILVRWFQKGDLHPKFRFLIIYQMFTIVLLCIAGILLFRYITDLSCATAAVITTTAPAF
eukprot:m.21805 g.21805  ORF g.21805 m.21805 type:complete len:133 (-) comp13543_c1_seq1:357-755(-)